jgi:5-methylcytosine-specific restriction endonuclease McrA
MSVNTVADVGGHTITLIVNGARLTMDLRTAHEICHQLAHQLDQLAQDQVVKRQQDLIDRRYS